MLGIDRHLLSHILPLRPGLFDLTIVDEASQVNLSSSTPAIFGANERWLLVIPCSSDSSVFLSSAAENAALVRHGVAPSYRVTHRFSRRSLFDVADAAVPQRATFILDEHFRSQPHIIGFSNEEFYKRTMRIMTQRPHSEGRRRSKFVTSEGEGQVPRSATTPKFRLQWTSWVKSSLRQTPEDPSEQLGCRAPLRDQANALGIAVTAKYPEAVVKHKITHGTAHSLQGDERDIVVFSTVIDPDFVPGTLRFLEDPNLFNVAITRASQRLIVLTSITPEQLPAGPTNYLSKFLAHANTRLIRANCPMTFGSGFEREVAEEILRHRGWSVISQYPSCGFKIDLVVSSGQTSSPSNVTGTQTTSTLMAPIRVMTFIDMSSCIEPGGQSSGCPCLHGEQPPKDASKRSNECSSIHLNRAIPLQPELPIPARAAPQGKPSGRQGQKSNKATKQGNPQGVPCTKWSTSSHL